MELEGGFMFTGLRREEIVQVEGRSYEVVGMDIEGAGLKEFDCLANVTYRVRDVETKGYANLFCRHKVILSLPPPPSTIQVEEEGYFEITHLSPEGVVTLTPFSTRGGEEPVLRTFDLDVSRDQGDIKTIGEGLMNPDVEVFCNVVTVMGKEVLGNVKYMPMESPIMKMPDLVMDTIFSFLSCEDLLRCRLVTRKWADYLPLKKFLNSVILTLDNNPEPSRGHSISVDDWDCQRRRNIYRGGYDVSLASLHPDLLKKVEHVILLVKNENEVWVSNLQTILDNCCNVKKLNYAEASEQGQPYYPMSLLFIQNFIAKNKGNLEEVKMFTNFCTKEDDVSQHLLSLFASCQSLRKLWINLRAIKFVRELNFLTLSLKNLRLLGLSQPLTKSQVIWISTHLPNLKKCALQVVHSHSHSNNSLANDEDDDEVVDENEVGVATVITALTNLKSLEKVGFILGVNCDPVGNNFPYRTCARMTSLKSNVLERMKDFSQSGPGSSGLYKPRFLRKCPAAVWYPYFQFKEGRPASFPLELVSMVKK